jgi:RNA polymerase sigma-70 factor (ECF subfamily)
MELGEHLSGKAKEDFELVIKASQDNNQQAFAELLSRYRDSIYYTFFKMVRNEEDAEDLTIETFGKAFRNLHKYQPDFAFSTWLFKIATNNGIDFLRKKRLKTTSIDKEFHSDDGDSFALEIKASDPDPEDILIKDQKKEILKSVVDQLKPRYKILIELRYYEELSYEEISEKLQLPLGTVKAQLFRAKDLLYQIVKNNKGEF